jgi:hypothetical protein
MHRNHLRAKGEVEGRKCQAREGLVTAGGELMEKDMTGALKDAGNALGARKSRDVVACALRDDFWETGKQPGFSVRHSLKKREPMNLNRDCRPTDFRFSLEVHA